MVANEKPLRARVAYRTSLGKMWHADSLDVMSKLKGGSVDLVVTSPPFALTTKLAYGNRPENEWVDWFMPFAEQFQRLIPDDGSIVIDLGGSWLPGHPVKSLYPYRLLIRLVDELGLFLAEDFVWFNRAKVPGPAKWVNQDRVRVKDAINTIWWLSKTPNPRASNLEVLTPYTPAMKALLKKGRYNTNPRPGSGRRVGEKSWANDRGGAIPPNVIEATPNDLDPDDPVLLAERRLGWPITNINEPDTVLDFGNNSSNDVYNVFARQNELLQHPARFPVKVPEFFIRFLTKPNDTVLDPFGGSNVTGAVAEGLGRKWVAAEVQYEYIRTSIGRFDPDAVTTTDSELVELLDKLRHHLETKASLKDKLPFDDAPR